VRVAIVGMGVVGRAQARMFSGHDLVTYDAADGVPYPADRIADCDFAVVCVGTPGRRDGTANLSFLFDALDQLPASLPVLIRSTVPPGTTGRIRARRTGYVCHAPEFMHERPGAAWQETTDVPWMLLGGAPLAREFFRPRLEQVFPGTIHGCDAVTAELAKYTANLYWATRVTFVSEMAAICDAAGADWEDVRQAWLQDPRMTPEYTAMAGFGPGFGGRCWPKDLVALIAASENAGYKPGFLEAVRDANARFRP
jgi:UDPglucose 6-dehydrogenase